MDSKPADFDQYWQRTLDDLAGFPARPELDLLPLRTTDFATLYCVPHQPWSLSFVRLFEYPNRDGTVSRHLYAPEVSKCVGDHSPGHRQSAAQRLYRLCLGRARAAQLRHAVCRDVSGLLTEGIEHAESYIFRGLAADSVRGLEFLLLGANWTPRGSSWWATIWR